MKTGLYDLFYFIRYILNLRNGLRIFLCGEYFSFKNNCFVNEKLYFVMIIKLFGVESSDVREMVNYNNYNILCIAGKNQLKTALLLEAESGTKAIQLLGVQAALTGSALSPCELQNAIDSVSTADVRNVRTFIYLMMSNAPINNIVFLLTNMQF